MAIVNRPALDLEFSFIDERGQRASSSFNMPFATLAADAETGIVALGTAIDALSGCALVSRSIVYGGREIDPAAIAPVADQLTGVKGVFVFNTGVGKTVTYTIPGFDLTKVDADGNIDTADADVTAFVTALTTLANNYSDSNGQTIASLAKAYVDTR